MEKFYIRFNAAMRDKGYKQADIAEKTGIAPGTISNYAVGKYSPKGMNLAKLADALDVNEAWLDGYDAPKQRRHYIAGVNGIENPESWELEYYSENDAPSPEVSEELTREELDLVTSYRDADPNIKKAVRLMLGMES